MADVASYIGDIDSLGRHSVAKRRRMKELLVFGLSLLLPPTLATPQDGNSVEFDLTPPSPSCTLTQCGLPSLEPLSPDVRDLRASTCTLENSKVEAIIPGSTTNPTNVKNVERIFPESMFNDIFPQHSPAYTYENLLKAIGKYPAVCSSPASCPRILATMFAHFQQETAGLVYTEEINKSDYCADWSAWVTSAYPCSPGRQYYGRGAMQLSWNYNYGAFSRAIFGYANVLLERPDLVATTWLNFASALWFLVTPQPPKPSMLQVLNGSWRPGGNGGPQPGFGATTLIINGGQECGVSPANPTGARNRAAFYRRFAARLGVEIAGEELGCAESSSFSSQGAARTVALYWAPENGCKLVTWQTAYSALVEGDYSACRGRNSYCASPDLPNPVTPLRPVSNPLPPFPTPQTPVQELPRQPVQPSAKPTVPKRPSYPEPQPEPEPTHSSRPNYPKPNYPISNYPQPNSRRPNYPRNSNRQPHNPQPYYPQSNYPQSNYPQSTYPQSNYPQSNYPQSNYPQSNYPQSNYPQSNYPKSTRPNLPSWPVPPTRTSQPAYMGGPLVPSRSSRPVRPLATGKPSGPSLGCRRRLSNGKSSYSCTLVQEPKLSAY